jgi:hypothetical protein
LRFSAELSARVLPYREATLGADGSGVDPKSQ